MHPKEELFGATEIYFDGEKITSSNPFGFSVNKHGESDLDVALFIDREVFQAQFQIASDLMRDFIRSSYEYRLECIEIDGLKYTFADGERKIVMEYKEMTAGIKKIRVGQSYVVTF